MIAALVTSLVVAAAAGLVAGRLARRYGSADTPTGVLVTAVTLAALPFALHYGWTIEYASTYGANHPDQPVGMYPELQTFRLLVPAAVLIWIVAAVFLVRKLPVAAALSPVLFFALYWSVGLKSITGAEGGVRLDNAASIVLFLLCIGIAAFASSFSLAAMGATRSLGREAASDRDRDRRVGSPS